MEMKIDAERIRQMRTGKAWSQEHLAAVTGLSVRTIQRIETGGLASPESKMALAAAFGVEPSSLDTPIAPGAPETSAAAPVKRGVCARHVIVYVLVCGLLLAVNIYKHGSPSWAIYPAAGWGLLLLLRSVLRRRAEVGD